MKTAVKEKPSLKPARESLHHVDATPDDGYVIRILEAHLHNNDMHWDVLPKGGGSEAVANAINDACRQRVVLLKKAIQILKNSEATP